MYKLNMENTGLDSDDKVLEMVRLMRRAGHDVEFTRDFGAINPSYNSDEMDTWSAKEWDEFLIAADEAVSS